MYLRKFLQILCIVYFIKIKKLFIAKRNSIMDKIIYRLIHAFVFHEFRFNKTIVTKGNYIRV